MSPSMIPFRIRHAALTALLLLTAVFAALMYYWPDGWVITIMPLVILVGFSLFGVRDVLQTRHARGSAHYPIAAQLRFFLGESRPEIRQYFL